MVYSVAYMMNFIKKYSIELICAGYAFVRIFSFFLYRFDLVLLQQLSALLIVVGFTYISTKRNDIGFVLILGEILFGGAGQFLILGEFILRTWMLFLFGCIWIIQKRYKGVSELFTKKEKIIVSSVLIVIAYAIMRGFLHKHQTGWVLQDAMLYLFILFIIPFKQYSKTISKFGQMFFDAFIYCTSVFSFVTFLIYSSGIGFLPDTYYHWFRNIVGGKITDLGNNFYRIVTSEQLLLVPIILILFSYLLHNISFKQNKKTWILFFLSLASIILNFTRIYFIAIIIGSFFLLSKKVWKKWLVVAMVAVVFSTSFLVGTSLVASGGDTTGLDLVGVKIASIARPSDDASGVTRMLLLPQIFEKIERYPILGSGLGISVQFIDPVKKEMITRTQFDWGYFEMITELGGLGVLVYMTFIFPLCIFLYKKKISSRLAVGYLAGIIALCIVNVTTPALFQGFGVLYLVGSGGIQKWPI